MTVRRRGSRLTGGAAGAAVMGAAGAVAMVAVALPALVAPAVVLEPPGAGAATGAGAAHGDGTTHVGALRSLPCKPVDGQPAVVAPTWAQSAGAGAQTGGWWCQLPHATKMPSNFVAASRVVNPLPSTYADFATQYVPASARNAVAHAAGTTAPSITVSTRVDSAVTAPTEISYGKLPTGPTVALGHGVKATVRQTHDLVSVVWRYPRSGVPRYLNGVATVAVTGQHVPKATVLAVARTVRPD